MNEPLTILHTARKILFVGSGLSISLGMPSWTKILQTVAEQNLSNQELDIVLEDLKFPGKEYQTADYISNKIGRTRLEESVILELRKHQNEVSRRSKFGSWTGLIQKMGLNGIITTNWDTLLELICGYDGLIWPKDLTKFVNSLRNKRPFILYLHGNLNSPPLAITSRDCDEVKSTFDSWRATLNNLLSIHYMIFIGYSFPDKHINETLAMSALLAGPESRILIVLTRESQSDPFKRHVPELEGKKLVIDFKEYSDFEEAFIELVSYCDPSSTLLLLQDSQSIDALSSIITAQTYDFATTSTLRQHYLDSNNTKLLLDFSADLIVDNFLSDKSTSGILATILSTLSDHWEPKGSLLEKLNQKSLQALSEGDTSLIGIIEPLVFAIASKGLSEGHRRYMHVVVDDMNWRNADTRRVGNYYGRMGTQLAALDRHIGDSRRQGRLLQANDVGRLLNLLRTEPTNIAPKILALTGICVHVFDHLGEQAYARKIRDEVRSILAARKLPLRPKWLN